MNGKARIYTVFHTYFQTLSFVRLRIAGASIYWRH